MSETSRSALSRRGFLVTAGALGTGAVLAGCTGNDPVEATGQTGQAAAAAGSNAKPGKPVTIGFSAPAADHGWIAAISKNAQAQAGQYEEVTLEATEGTNDVNQQISQVQTLIDKNVDVLVILPFDGKALTEIARDAMLGGIPVVNLDRIFASPLAYRTWIGGDNYGMGVNAGHYIGTKLEDAGTANPVIVEVAGIDNLELTQQRSQGFKDALSTYGFDVTARQAAEFTVESGQRVMSTLLQAEPEIDAVWNHDDDQGVGVLAAIDQAGRDEFFMVGGAGSRRAMEDIKSGSGPLEATVLYSPSMASSSISLARLIGQGRGMSDLVEREVPASVTTYSAVVTKDNVDRYMSVAFD